MSSCGETSLLAAAFERRFSFSAASAFMNFLGKPPNATAQETRLYEWIIKGSLWLIPIMSWIFAKFFWEIQSSHPWRFLSHEAATFFEWSSCQSDLHPPYFSRQGWNISHPSKKHTTSYQIMSKYYLSPCKQSSQAWRKSSRNTRTFSLVPGGTAALTCVAIGATTTKEMTLKESCQWYRKVIGDADAGRWCQMVLQLDNM